MLFSESLFLHECYRFYNAYRVSRRFKIMLYRIYLKIYIYFCGWIHRVKVDGPASSDQIFRRTQTNQWKHAQRIKMDKHLPSSKISNSRRPWTKGASSRMSNAYWILQWWMPRNVLKTVPFQTPREPDGLPEAVGNSWVSSGVLVSPQLQKFRGIQFQDGNS